jgi:hypothetical protein
VGGRRAVRLLLLCAALPHRGIVKNNEITMPALDQRGEFRLVPRGFARGARRSRPPQITMKNNEKNNENNNE